MSLSYRIHVPARRVLAALLLAASFLSPAIADDSLEREHLAAILRQLDRIDR